MASATSDALKIVVLGNSGAGKSSLLNRFVNERFDMKATLADTITGAYLTKSMMVGAERLKLQLWDTAGSEAFRSITRMYYRHASAAVICYDITDYHSFTELRFWIRELMENEPNCRRYICGCKLDLQQERRQVPLIEARDFAEDRGSIHFETSARTGENVDALFDRICCDAVNWNFVSIISGQRYQATAPADDMNLPGGAKASFSLTNRLGVGSNKGCTPPFCT